MRYTCQDCDRKFRTPDGQTLESPTCPRCGGRLWPLQGGEPAPAEPSRAAQQAAAAWCNRGCERQRANAFDEAMDCYNKALALDPRNGATWYNRALALQKLGRRTEALASYDKALEIDPCDTLAWNNKGLILAALGRHAEATACFDWALAIDPENAAGRYNREQIVVRTAGPMAAN